MCGISGIIDLEKRADYNSTIREMSCLLKHRGPDATGYHIEPDLGIYLGFNRLSIIDLSERAMQPMSNEDGSVIMMVNGEIYNYKSLRKELKKLGHQFRCESDSEVVIHCYEEWGLNCFPKLRGMFAIAIWDRDKRRLCLVRDRFGIKPLYYLNTTRLFAFSSEVKGFLALNLEYFKREIDENILEFYLTFPFIPDNRNTIFRDVKKVPPAHILIFEDGKIEEKKYWELKKNEDIAQLSFDDALERLDNLLKESVRLRLQADVPVAAMVSGGVDSSLIAALMDQETGGKGQIFTASFDHPSDESHFAHQLAEFVGVECYEIRLEEKNVLSRLEEVVWYADDLCNTSFFIQFFLAERMREMGIKVILVGEGADETFGGYHLFKLSQWPFTILPLILRNGLYYQLISAQGLKPSRMLQYHRVIKKTVNMDGADAHQIISQFELGMQLPNFILMGVDKGIMAQSIEARVPYLDHKLVEFVYSLPKGYKIKGHFYKRGHKQTKYILRVLAKKYIPNEISQRPKFGMGLLTYKILNANLEAVRADILDNRSIALNFFPKIELERMLKEVDRYVRVLWKLAIIEMWRKRYSSLTYQ